MNATHKRRLEALEKSTGTDTLRLVVSEDGETFYTVSQPHEEIAPETLRQWEQRGEQLLVIDFDDARL